LLNSSTSKPEISSSRMFCVHWTCPLCDFVKENWPTRSITVTGKDLRQDLKTDAARPMESSRWRKGLMHVIFCWDKLLQSDHFPVWIMFLHASNNCTCKKAFVINCPGRGMVFGCSKNFVKQGIEQ
jgi:hypothetical protein